MSRYNKLFIIVAGVAFFLRLILSTSAHHGDLNNNISWGTIALEKGLSGFYGSSDSDDWPYSAPNQPPLSILTFASLMGIWKTTREHIWNLNWNYQVFPSKLVWFWDEKGKDLMIKLPSIFDDIGIAILIYRFFKEKKKEKTALALSIVWLFNPVTWYNSSVWGQTDGVVNFLGLFAVLALLEKKLLKFAIAFTLCILFKGSLILFTPILLFIAYRQKHALLVWAKSVLFSLSTILVTSIWFNPKPNFFTFFVELYKDRIFPGEIGYLTANAFNFWWLIDPGKVPDSTLFLNFPARSWGFFIITLFLSLIIVWLRQKASLKGVFTALSLISLASFLFLTRIHERYLYPFFPYATILLGFVPGLWIIYFSLTVTHILNLYHLFWWPSLPLLQGAYENLLFPNFLALTNLLIFILLIQQVKLKKL